MGISTSVTSISMLRLVQRRLAENLVHILSSEVSRLFVKLWLYATDAFTDEACDGSSRCGNDIICCVNGSTAVPKIMAIAPNDTQCLLVD